MSLVFALYVGIPAVTIGINGAIVTWVATRYSHVRGSRWFVLSLSFGVAWMLSQVAHYLLSDVGLQILAATFAGKFAVLSFVCNIVFASRYTGVEFHRGPVFGLPLIGVALVALLPTWMAPFRGLFYGEWVARSEPFDYVVAEPTAGYAATGIVIAVLATYGLYHLVGHMLATPRRSAVQLVFLVFGSLSMMIAIALGNLGVFPIAEVSNAEFGVLPYGVFVTLALFRFRLFEVQPVARNAVIEKLQDPVFVLDGDDRLVDYNRVAARIDPAVTDSIGQEFDAVLPALASELESESVEGGSFSTTVDGRSRHFSVTVSRAGDLGRGGDWRSVLLRDVTELERSRWRLTKQNDRLEQVASTISHDLRNPINVAEGHAALLEDRLSSADLDEADREQARDHLVKIRDSNERMLAIIEDVLALARGGKAVIETEFVRLDAVTREAWGNVETGEASLSVVGDTTLQADRSRLLTVFENLFRNSVEHGLASVPDEAEDALCVTVGATDDGFYVADDGTGIPAEHRDSVFEYGYSGDDGTGLGLSIVATLAESHGWTVELDEAADGARFVFATVGDSSAESTPSTGTATAGVRVDTSAES